MKTFYDNPTQVMFCDEEGNWECGIAWGENIICGCCGAIFNIQEVIEDAPEDVKTPIHAYTRWLNISEEIHGGENPESFNEEAEEEAEHEY